MNRKGDSPLTKTVVIIIIAALILIVVLLAAGRILSFFG